MIHRLSVWCDHDIGIIKCRRHSVPLRIPNTHIYRMFLRAVNDTLHLRSIRQDRIVIVSLPVLSSRPAAASDSKSISHSIWVSRNKKFRKNDQFRSLSGRLPDQGDDLLHTLVLIEHDWCCLYQSEFTCILLDNHSIFPPVIAAILYVKPT